MTRPMICPHCGQADQVEKVSTIYVLGIEKKWRSQNNPSPGDDPSPPPRSALVDKIPAEELQALSRRLAPPATKKAVPLRSIHPDMMVATFSLAAPIFLYGILNSQPGELWIVLPVLAAFYAFYFWKRKELIAKFQSQQDAQRSAEARVQRGIQRWMKLYYCARDDGIFELGSAAITPADQINGYLFRD